MKKILVCETDPAIRTLLCRFLTAQNYQVQSAENEEWALEIFRVFDPDLVVMSIDSLKSETVQLRHSIQEIRDVRCLLLTKASEEGNSADIGFLPTDVQVTKPFDLYEVAARIKNMLEDSASPPLEPTLSIPNTREVRFNGELIDLTDLEFKLLYCLACNPNKVWRRVDLIFEVWDDD